MIVDIKNKELAKGLEDLAKQEGMSVDELVEQLLSFGLDHGVSTLALRRLEYAVVHEIIPSLKNLEVFALATRHQLTNLYADISEDTGRVEKIANEATQIAFKQVFENMVKEVEDDDKKI